MKEFYDFRVYEKKTKHYINQYRIGALRFKDINNGLYIFEQFTGLIDKRNRRIYVGDIVKFEDTAYCDEYGSEICNVEQLAQVICDKYKGFIVSNFQFKDSDLAYEFDEVWYNMDLETFWSRVEVIGNINENKELLENE